MTSHNTNPSAGDVTSAVVTTEAAARTRDAVQAGDAAVYHPDPAINAEVIADAIDAERADLAAGHPPRRWLCPCGAEHGRGHFLSSAEVAATACDTALARAEKAEHDEQVMARTWGELRCPSCEGRYGHQTDAGWEDCSACDGTGVSNDLILRAETAEAERDALRGQLQEAREAFRRDVEQAKGGPKPTLVPISPRPWEVPEWLPEWKRRAQKADDELTDAEWERESLREKANRLEVERGEAVEAVGEVRMTLREKSSIPDPVRAGDVASMVAEFNEHPNSSGRAATWALMPTLLQEEHEELIEALGEGDRDHVARELADVVYLAYTTAWSEGINLDAALAEVHRAAMDKIRANVRREDGKVIKPPGFVPPDMTEAVSPEGK